MTSTPNNTEGWRERSDAGPSIQWALRPAGKLFDLKRERGGYFFLGDDFFCERSLPATLFDVLLNWSSRSTLDASVATFLLVDFAFAILSIPLVVATARLRTFRTPVRRV